MNKSDFIRAMANKGGIAIKDAESAFDAFVATVTDALNAGDKVQISGFGSFEIKSKPAREGVNPATGEKIKIAASKLPVFKFGKAFKDSFNK